MIFLRDMKNFLLMLYIGLLVITVLAAKQRSDKPIKVSYIVESEREAENDLITIVMRFELFDPSLEEAYLAAHNLLEEIEQTINNFCQENRQDQDYSCNGIFEKGQFQIQPIYQSFRGIQTFKSKMDIDADFFLSFEVTLHVSATDNIGQLVDQLVIYKKAIIEEMKWDELQSENEENLMEKGVRHGIQTCASLGLKMKKIESVEIVEPEKVSRPATQEEPAEGEEEQQQEEAPSEQLEGIIELKISDFDSKYRFSVLCSS